MPNGLPTTAPATTTLTAGAGTIPIASPGASVGGIPGNIANILSSLFGAGTSASAYENLQRLLGKGIGTQQQSLQQILEMLSPFQQTGASAVQRELGLLGAAGGDPTALVNQILGQFQQSPAQQATIQAGLEAVRNRMGAQGLGTSGAEQKELEQFAQQQTAQQQQQFLQDVLGARGQTLSGLGQLGGFGLGAAQTGAGAELQIAQNIANLLASKGLTGISEAGTEGGLFSGLIGSIADLFKGRL